ncbi:MAG: hypothetical protein IT370_07350 [Deltaproteobacteria bacterium]|nr:hypothetical protein [Deltaproteobacteria bacterium]
MRRFVLVFAALAGCTVRVNYGGTHYRCDDGQCPTGYQCIAAVCELPLAPDAGASDGGDATVTVDDAGNIVDAAPLPDGTVAGDSSVMPDAAPARCGTFALLSDDFSDGARGEPWGESYANAPSTIAETGGRLTVNLAAGAGNGAYAGYATQRSYDLRGERFAIEAVQMPPATTTAQGYFNIGIDGQNLLELVVEGGQLYAQYQVNGTGTVVRQVAYNATNHRFWAFREASSRLFFEVSSDGTTWTELGSAAAPFSLALLKANLGGGTYRAEPVASSVVFDNVGVRPAPTARATWCKPGALTDDFNDGVVGRPWGIYRDGSGALAETGGVVVETVPVNAAGGATLYSRQAFDLQSSMLTVRLAQSVNPATSALATLRIEVPGHYADLTVQNGQLGVGYDDMTLATMTYVPATHRWLRLRESAGQLFWETSADGVTFTPRLTRATPFAVSAVVVAMEAYSGAGFAAPGGAQWDDYNLPP